MYEVRVGAEGFERVRETGRRVTGHDVDVLRRMEKEDRGAGGSCKRVRAASGGEEEVEERGGIKTWRVGEKVGIGGPFG